MSNHLVKPANFTQDDPWNNAMPYLPNFSVKSAEPFHFMLSMPLRFALISGATAAVTDTYEMQVLGRNLHAVQVANATGAPTMSATVEVDATLDMQTWFQIDSITAPTIKQYSGIYTSIRVSIPTYTAGTITVTGLSQRS